MSEQHFFGTRKDTSELIYLTSPSWNCDWYWGFGYLGNINCHYHLDGYQTKERFLHLADGKTAAFTEKRNISMHDALLADYELNPLLAKRLWEFCDLVLSAYALKEAAAVLGCGGSHMAGNPPAKDQVLDAAMAKDINEKKLPAIFAAIERIFTQ